MLFRFTAFSLGSYARENNAHEFWLSLETTANMNWVQLFHMDALSWLRTVPWDNGIWTCTKHLHYTMEKMALRFEEDIYTYVIYIYIMSMQSFWKLTLRLTVYERQAPGRNIVHCSRGQGNGTNDLVFWDQSCLDKWMGWLMQTELVHTDNSEPWDIVEDPLYFWVNLSMNYLICVCSFLNEYSMFSRSAQTK